MSQVFRADTSAGWCPKCRSGYAIGPHHCPVEDLEKREKLGRMLAENAAGWTSDNPPEVPPASAGAVQK